MGSEYRLATISGSAEGCHRAKKMVEEIVAEVMQVNSFSTDLVLSIIV